MLNPSLSHLYETPVTASYLQSQNLSSIENIIKDTHENSDTYNKEKILFCYKALEKALQAYLNEDFTAYDALTATTCCHGIAVLVRQVIEEICRFDIEKILIDLNKKIEKLLSVNCIEEFELSHFRNYYLPNSILILTKIFIIAVIKERDCLRGGWRTVVQKLKEISPIGSKFCGDIVKQLQTFFSNLVADGYANLLNQINSNILINNIPIKLWGKYVQPEYIRVDRRGRKYAPCLYSMQITLAYLIQTRAKIAIVNDLKCEKGIFKERYIQLLEGDGHSKFNAVNDDYFIKNGETKTPIIVYGGCTHSSNLNGQAIKFQMNPWLSCFERLVLACDTFYPQFPLVRDDPGFNNAPIDPIEDKIMQVINKHTKITGVAACNPSLFCLTHIYVASLKQIRQALEGDQSCLFQSFIPENKRDSSA